MFKDLNVWLKRWMFKLENLENHNVYVRFYEWWTMSLVKDYMKETEVNVNTVTVKHRHGWNEETYEETEDFLQKCTTTKKTMNNQSDQMETWNDHEDKQHGLNRYNETMEWTISHPGKMTNLSEIWLKETSKLVWPHRFKKRPQTGRKNHSHIYIYIYKMVMKCERH